MIKRIVIIISALLLLPLLFSCFETEQTATTGADQTAASGNGAAATGTAAADTQTGAGASGTEQITEETAGGDQSAKTAAPVINGSVLLSSTAVMIYGKCEKDCVIGIKNGDEAFSVRADGDNFCFAASVKTSKKTSITVTAKADGKGESEAVTCSVKGDKNAEDKGLTVTYGSRVMERKLLPDLYGTNAFTEKELKTIKELAEYRVKKAREASGKNTKIVYVIAPNPLAVYGEEITDGMRSKIENSSARLHQVSELLSKVDGVTFIDLTDTLIANKDAGKLYYKLDSHWTELGAYFGYKAIMDRIGAASHPLSDYEIEYITIDDTDMNVYSGVGTGEMYEDAPFLHAKFTEQTPYGANKTETARIWDFVNMYFKSTSKTYTNDSSRPSAVLIMDSYGLNAVPFLAESFSRFGIQPVWYYNADYGLISELKADYVIEILEERDLSVLLSGS